MTKQITFEEAKQKVVQSLIDKGYVYNSITNVYYKGTESAFNEAKIFEAAFYLGQQSNIDRIKELEEEVLRLKKRNSTKYDKDSGAWDLL